MALTACAQSPIKPKEMTMTNAQRLFFLMKDIEDRQEIITPEQLAKILPVTVKLVPGDRKEPFHEVTPIAGGWLEGTYISYMQRGVLGDVKGFSLSIDSMEKLGCFKLRTSDLDQVFGKGNWSKAPSPVHITVAPFPDGPDGEIRLNTYGYAFGGIPVGKKIKHSTSFSFDQTGCMDSISLINFVKVQEEI
jgi:hypothetical protein